MRKIVCIIILLLGALSASGQHYIGVKGGYGAAQGRLYNDYGAPRTAMLWNKSTAGVVWKYFSPTPTWGGVSAELEYQQRGYRTFDGGVPGNISIIISDSTSYRIKTRTVSSLTLPLVWQPHLYMMNRKVRVWLSAGITVSYNLGMGDKYTVVRYAPEMIWDDQENNRYHWVSTPTETVSSYKMQTARDVRWNYGWLGGVGVGVLSGRWEFFAEGRYYYGMSDVLRTKTKYQFNEEEPIRSELDNIFITVGVAFRLGKGGILAPPRRRGAPAAPSENDFRNIRRNR